MNPTLATTLEWLANGFTLWCVWLAARGHLMTWPVGIVGCLLFGALFMESRLYADATLQLFFIATGVIGWRQWLHAGGPVQAQAERALSFKQLAAMVAAAVVVTLVYGALLRHWTAAYAPFWDSAVLASSVLAQVLLMRGHAATWPAWLVVNTLSVPLYFSRGLLLTAGVYTLFWLNAWYGWYRWHRLKPLRAAATAP